VYQSSDMLTIPSVGYSGTVRHWRLLTVAAAKEATMAASSVPLDKSAAHWLVICSCGWDRECSSEMGGAVGEQAPSPARADGRDARHAR
jgi:hypothetical protein